MSGKENGECSRNLDDSQQPSKKARLEKTKEENVPLSKTYNRNFVCCVEDALNHANRILTPTYNTEERKTKHRNTYLRQWQATQISVAYIDNTLNMMFENYLSNSSPSSGDVEFIRSRINNRYLVDEGISMAIESHGLHPTAPVVSETVEAQPSSSNKEESPKSDNDKDTTDFLDTAVLAAINENGLIP